MRAGKHYRSPAKLHMMQCTHFQAMFLSSCLNFFLCKLSTFQQKQQQKFQFDIFVYEGHNLWHTLYNDFLHGFSAERDWCQARRDPKNFLTSGVDDVDPHLIRVDRGSAKRGHSVDGEQAIVTANKKKVFITLCQSFGKCLFTLLFIFF